VKRYFGGRNPLGLRVGVGSGPDVKPTMEIVGVMSDFSYRGLREDSDQAYFPHYEWDHPSGTFYVRVRGTPESSFATLRDIVRKADPSLPMTNFRTVNEQVERSLNSERMLATLSSSFSILALLLSLVGLYGVMSFVVTQRTREIGIRLALGARRWSTIWLVLRDALVMILSGIAVGLPIIWSLGRLVESQLYSVKPWDPAVLAGVILTLSIAGIAATTLPAARASSVNPTTALRTD
jgi:ABC-type antimicrobial peptide transport system permease subunit